VRFWLPFLALIVAAVLAWRIGKRSRVAGFSLVWMLVFLSPALIGLPVFTVGEWIHDRYLYLPSVGFCMLLVMAIAQLPSKRELFRLPALPTAVVLLLAAAMAFGTSVEEIPWSNDFTLFLHAALLQPESPQAQSHLATEFYRRGDVADAEFRYQKAIQLDPANWKNRLAYGLMLFYSGQFERSDRELADAIAIQPRDSNEYFYQGMDRFNLGQYESAQQAFAQAIKTGPTRTRYHFWLGFALERQGHLEQAQAEYQDELTQHPDTDTDARARLHALNSRTN
jgi:tetratricopeptide (TPR) repeat protein